MKIRKSARLATWFTFLALLLSAPLATVHAKAIEGTVNINTASAQELSLLPGIGKAKAAEIIKQRQSKPFASLEDLKSVKGIGPKRLEAMRPHVAFSGATTAKKISTKKAAQPKAPSSAAKPSS